MRSYAFVAFALLTVGLAVSCGGEATKEFSVGSLFELVPGDAESYTFADLDGIRDEGLDDLEDQIADLISARDLRDWDIDLSPNPPKDGLGDSP